MINYATLNTCFASLIGFRQTQSKDYPALDADLLLSTSNRYYQDFHPLLTLENIYAVAPRFSEYQEAYTYSTWLKEKQTAALQAVMAELLQKYKLEAEGKSIMQTLRLYEGQGSYTDKIIKQDRLVGFEISFQTYRDLEIIINGIGVQFDTANPTFNLYLYQGTELKKTITLNTTGGNLFTWPVLSEPLSFNGGTYYLIYNEAELLGQAIKREANLSKAPCTSCSHYNQAAYKQWSEYVAVKSVSYDVATATPTYFDNTNWGLNLQVAVQCALSQVICEQKALFVDALGKQMAVDLLTAMAYSTRNNDQKIQLAQLAFAALDNSPNGMPGMRVQRDNAIKALHLDITDFDSRCLPCAPTRKITYKTI